MTDAEAIHNARLAEWREEVAKAIKALTIRLSEVDPGAMPDFNLSRIMQIDGEPECPLCDDEPCGIYRHYRIEPNALAPGGWGFCHFAYDGHEDGRMGHGSSFADCVKQIDERIDEGFDD